MARATFRRDERLTDARDFQHVFERRRSVSDDKLIVYGVENGRAICRLGLSVGRKKVRRAHDRNRFKRVVREAFRLSKAELPAGVDLVVVPKSSARLSLADVRLALPSLAQAVARRLGPRPAKVAP
ncbi:MAG: ribonuclease P protein component [Isosphaeraceae bacterium]|nr:ribonuclease P protein component [Isosphaeraceae bacterium]